MQPLLERETTHTAGEGLYHGAHLECQGGPTVKLVCGLDAPITDLREEHCASDVYCVVCYTAPMFCPVCSSLLVAR